MISHVCCEGMGRIDNQIDLGLAQIRNQTLDPAKTADTNHAVRQIGFAGAACQRINNFKIRQGAGFPCQLRRITGAA